MLQTMDKPAWVLVNLGTPDAPTPRAVKRFLWEFLSDKRVVRLSKYLWYPLLKFLVLPLRAKRVAGMYQKIWLPQGSPMRVISQKQKKGLQKKVEGRAVVYDAMRYGNPSLKLLMKDVIKKHDTIVVLPLYPQFSSTTTQSVIDVVEKIQKENPEKTIKVVEAYYQNALYTQALVESIQNFWKTNSRGEKLLFSFHGLPQYCVDEGDPYVDQCRETAKQVAAQLNLSDLDFAISFQSRFGATPWVQPYTEDILKSWGNLGIQSVDVVSPSFSNDCLETLEEICHTLKDVFLDNGGKKYQYIPALNDSELHLEMMYQLFSAKDKILL